jgi:RNA polymerase sigma-70 factor, ECF subfamily
MQDLLLDIEAEIPALRRYARVLLRDTDAADDLVQDCLERALSRLPLWRRPDGNLRAWLFTILRHIQLNQCRSAARHPAPLSVNNNNDAPSAGDEQISRIEAVEALAAFRRLPDDQREVLALVVIEGLRYREVAALLGISIGTVMSRLARGRERLRRLVEEPGPTIQLRRVR